MGSRKENLGARAIKVEGQIIKLDKRPPLLLIGEPKDSSGYECGPGVHLEDQTVVQDGHDWKSFGGLPPGDIAVSSVEDPEVRKVTRLLSASELRFI